MRFVDNQDGSQTSTVARIQNLAEFDQEIGFRFPVPNVEERGEVLIELRYRQARIEDVGHQHRAIQSLYHPA